ncbi:hypothetical protein LSM04_001505 [Trypanosoma melophagium]|uniref:uncharacterized protein n=1 Tax=Trypanosoma melophagium TaxID=715481 RepID=UPI00351AA7CB|nr:hypothetical protein LSM04_001505 [Trypanosoma melophagium]
MSLSTVFLADGPQGEICQSNDYCDLIRVNENVWALCSSGKYVDVLDPHMVVICKWITIFRIVDISRGELTLEKDRVIPCASGRQLMSASLSHVISLDAESLITVWDSGKYTPIRLFKVDMAMEILHGSQSPSLFMVGTTQVMTFWTFASQRRFTWEHRVYNDNYTQSDLSQIPTSIVRQNENIYLCKNNSCLLAMTDAYRKKVVEISSSTVLDEAIKTATILTLDKRLGDQIKVLMGDSNKTNYEPAKKDSRDLVTYWQEKYLVEKEGNGVLLNTLEQIAVNLKKKSHNANLESQIADLMLVNSANQRTVSELRGHLLYLEAKLHEINVDGVSKVYPTQVIENRSEGYMDRISELQRELQNALENSESIEKSQQDVQKVVDMLSRAKETLNSECKKVLSLTDQLMAIGREKDNLCNKV